MKSTKITSLVLITAVAVTSLAAYAEIVTSMATFAETTRAPVSSSGYPEIPAMPPYIYMGMSAYTAPL